MPRKSYSPTSPRKDMKPGSNVEARVLQSNVYQNEKTIQLTGQETWPFHSASDLQLPPPRLSTGRRTDGYPYASRSQRADSSAAEF